MWANILLHLLTEERTSGRPSQPLRISHNVVPESVPPRPYTMLNLHCVNTHTRSFTHSLAGRSGGALFESEFLIVRATWCAPQIALIKSPINYAHQCPFSVAGFEHERLSSIMHRARASERAAGPFYAKRAHSRRRWVKLINAAPSVKVNRKLWSEKNLPRYLNKKLLNVVDAETVKSKVQFTGRAANDYIILVVHVDDASCMQKYPSGELVGI